MVRGTDPRIWIRKRTRMLRTTNYSTGHGNPLMIIAGPTIAVQFNCIFPSKVSFTEEENRIYHQIYQTIEQMV
jgi:hypothetical protein